VLHRLLDVVFHHLVPLVATVVLVPSAVLTVGLVTNRTDVVTARLWADQPAVLAGSPFTGLPGGETPAGHAVVVLTELIQTDNFLSTVKAAVDESGVRDTGDLTTFGTDVQRNFAVTDSGPNVVVVQYTSPRAELGLAVVRAAVAAFEQAQEAVQTGQVTVANQTLANQLTTAKKEMDDAVAAAQRYQSSHDLTSLATDASYQSLRTLATAKIATYTSLVQRATQASQFQSAIPEVQTTLLRTLDQPEAAPSQINLLKGPATRNALYALVAVAALELAFVYNVTRRDQHVRTTHEVTAALGVLSIGTVPAPADPKHSPPPG
jgi:hypothetical protein